MEDTITFDFNKDEAQDLLKALRCARSEGEDGESIDCMIETIKDFLQ